MREDRQVGDGGGVGVLQHVRWVTAVPCFRFHKNKTRKHIERNTYIAQRSIEKEHRGGGGGGGVADGSFEPLPSVFCFDRKCCDGISYNSYALILTTGYAAGYTTT